MKILIFGSLPTSEGGRCSYAVVTEYLGRWLLAGGHEVIYVEFPWAQAELCAVGVAKCLRVLAEERPDCTLYIGHPGSLGMMPPWPGPLAGLLTVEGPLMGELRAHLGMLDAVAAPSQFAASLLLPHVRPSVGAVSVIPHGVDLEIFHPADPVLRKDGPPRFLTVAANTPRKGLGNLILAFGAWRGSRPPDSLAARSTLDLATNIIGVGGHLGEACHAAGLAFEVVTEAGRPDRSACPVTFVGGWSERPDRLASLYRNADFYITSTLGEGFCMPVLEAMASGLRCLLPRHTALCDFPIETAEWWEPWHAAWVPEYSQAFSAISAVEAIELFKLSEFRQLTANENRKAALDYARANTWNQSWCGRADRIGILGLFAEAIANFNVIAQAAPASVKR